MNWLTVDVPERAQSLADTVVERFDLVPPVDVKTLLMERADLAEAPWPQLDCDAIAIGLGDLPRPRVFVRSTLPNLRKRFTYAHELGHVMSTWHEGQIGCHPATDAGPSEVAKAPGTPRIDLLEREATAFAGRLLVPNRFLESLADASDDIEELVAGLNQAKVSTVAALLALRQRLLPGFVFHVPSIGKRILTSGTYPGPPGDPEWIYRNAEEHAVVHLAGKEVKCFRLIPNVENLGMESDLRATTAILGDAIQRVWPESDLLKERNRINGVASGSLSKMRASTPEQAFGILQHKFGHDDQWLEIIDDPDFGLYLKRKAHERIASMQDT